ncbi:MAG: endospore germination permease [Clostridiales bacterium]|nr:endospore germination permease [Clostridiales bacterium]
MRTKKLAPWQIMVLTVSGILGVDILIVQHNMVSAAGVDGWISLTIGGMVIFAASIPVIYLMRLYPDKDVPQITIEVLGKWMGRLALIPLTVFSIVYAGLSARIIGQVLKMFLLDKTPMTVIVVSMVAAVIYLVDKGVYTLAAVVDIIFPMYMTALILLVVFSVPQANLANIRPVLFRNAGKTAGAIIPGIYNFTGYGTIPYFMCHLKSKKLAVKPYIIGLGIPVLLYIILTVITTMVFGETTLRAILYPILNLSKAIEFKSGILDRLESFMALFWIPMVFASIVIFTYISVRKISEIFSIKGKGKKYTSYTLLFLLPAVAMIIPKDLNVLETYNNLKHVGIFYISIFYPILALVAGVKKRVVKQK